MKNAVRTALTRKKLVDTARRLFAEHGFAAVSTEDILLAAEVTRGALYHHFDSKTALFGAVCLELSIEAADSIVRAINQRDTQVEALQKGTRAWITFMLQPAVSRILLVDAPSVLGYAAWAELDRQHAFQLLRDGVAAADAADLLSYDGDIGQLAIMLNGAMNALVLEAGQLTGLDARRAARHAVTAIHALLAAVTRPADPR